MSSKSTTKSRTGKKGNAEAVAATNPRDPAEPFLPPELLLAVMKWLASPRDLPTLATFMRSSKECYQLGLPVLYKRITLDDAACEVFATCFGSLEKFVADASKTKHIRELFLFVWEPRHLGALIALLWVTIPNLHVLEFVDQVKPGPLPHLALLTELSYAVAQGRAPSLSELSFGCISDGDSEPLPNNREFDVVADPKGLRLPLQLKSLQFDCRHPKLASRALQVLDALPNLAKITLSLACPGDYSEVKELLDYPRLLNLTSKVIVNPCLVSNVSAIASSIRKLSVEHWSEDDWATADLAGFRVLENCKNLKTLVLEEKGVSKLDSILPHLPDATISVNLMDAVFDDTTMDTFFAVADFLARPTAPRIIVHRRDLDKAPQKCVNLWMSINGVVVAD